MERAKGTDRILDILEKLSIISEPISRNTLARELDCPRSTIYSLIDQLVARDWVAIDESGGLALGYRAGLLGLGYGRNTRFEQVGRETVQRVALETGAVTEINVVDRWEQLVLISATGHSRNYLRTVEGSRYPLPITGSARLQLVGVPLETIRKNIPSEDFRLRSGEMLPFAQFADEIRQAERERFFIARGLIEPYIGTVGTPVRNRDGNCVATLSIILPQAELDNRTDELLAALHRGADELTSYLRTIDWPMGDRAHAELFRSE